MRKVRAEVKAGVKVPQLGLEIFCTIAALFCNCNYLTFDYIKIFFLLLLMFKSMMTMSPCTQLLPTLNRGIIQAIFPI